MSKRITNRSSSVITNLHYIDTKGQSVYTRLNPRESIVSQRITSQVKRYLRSNLVTVVTIARVDPPPIIEVDENTPVYSDSELYDKLVGMDYNDIRSLAKDLELSAKGSKEVIIGRIIEYYKDTGETPSILSDEEGGEGNYV